MNKIIKKNVEPTGDLCIKFTPEELKTLGIEPGDKFSWKEKDGGFLLEKYQKIDIDMSEFSREVLEMIITESCEKDISVNEVISNILQSAIKHFENKSCIF